MNLAPKGDGKTEIRFSTRKAKELHGEKNANIHRRVKLIAVQSIIEPEILYPLVATYFSPSDIAPIDSILTQMRCTALGLNKNFPRGIIHGPPLLGGMGIPSPHQKITKDRINYFLYNIRWKSDIHQQLNISIIYSQIEVGLFHQFFAIPFYRYGHLATQSFCVQIWRKNEPFGLQVHPSSNSTWIPSPTSPGDRALMEFATLSYNMKGSSMKNRCRIYLQLFSVCDLLIYKTSTIHPSYYKGVLPPSRESSNLSPNVPRPPQ